jgi:hypothetical protein
MTYVTQEELDRELDDEYRIINSRLSRTDAKMNSILYFVFLVFVLLVANSVWNWELQSALNEGTLTEDQ